VLPTRWDPFRELTRDLGMLHREFDELFRRTFGAERSSIGEDLRLPLVNTFVRDNILHVEAELPGVRREDLDVSVEGRVLTIRANISSESEVKEENFLLRESSKQSFLRRLDLPEKANAEEIHAKFDDGVLRLTMPMAEQAIEGRKIPIETGKKKVH